MGLHPSDIHLLKEVHEYFGVGNLRSRTKDNVFSVVKLSDILTHIIPHFDKYPLQKKKRADYLLFKEAVLAKASKEKDIKLKLLSLKASINWGLSEKLKNEYPLIVPAKRPEFEFDKPFDPNWIAGFVSGHGSFIVNYHKNPKNKAKYSARLIFLNMRDEALLNYMVSYFNCGVTHISKKLVYYDVQKFDDIINIIIPFFFKYKVKGVKWDNFLKWVEVSKIMEQNGHLTDQGIEEIRIIREQINIFNLKILTKHDKFD